MVFALVGPTIYTLTTLGLYYKVPIAGFIAWFIFIGPGVAEFTHFIFPALQPDIQPGNVSTITQTINGTEVANMPNYHYKITGHYYFAGMWTAALPMIPGIYSIFRLVKEGRRQNKLERLDSFKGHKLSSSVMGFSFSSPDSNQEGEGEGERKMFSALLCALCVLPQLM
jgi:hypothetical protein